MCRLSIQQIRGLKDLLQDGVEAGVNAVEETHQAIARQPFAVLEKIGFIAAPVQAIEHVERTLTGGVYGAIRTVNRLAGALATQVLDRLEERGEVSRQD